MAKTNKIKEWRIKMEICLKRVELAEEGAAGFKHLPDPLVNEMVNLIRDLEVERRG
jgi:hypothetical protein